MTKLFTGEQSVRITRAGALRAAIDGGIAYRAGFDSDACPFSNAGEIVERFHRFHRYHWLRAWWTAASAARADDAV
jgi:hypothetical protein